MAAPGGEGCGASESRDPRDAQGVNPLRRQAGVRARPGQPTTAGTDGGRGRDQR
eukprot:CAMPEP_0197899012 /NCGR_PEP_ID=MMETSP1439-20131203/45412_1 /TAXON_ID=66791 /ORGANISM="Gonyaulax spinifera, Strain CCMP409" /LENGTH=53 /DNA_ID=CAMNT_0043519777 /DNA_START=77 /DNA_END=234 /DNA_ORIENTATION=-